MSLLDNDTRTQLTEMFETLNKPVKMVVFTQEFECQYCKETREIAEELSTLSDKISLEVYDFVADGDLADQYGVDKIPATVILEGGKAGKDYGIRYYGIPSGYEFSSLIHDVMMVSAGDPQLSAEMLDWLAELKTPVHLQVFVTPTCPYCPQAVLLAHKLAMASDLVQADMVEATEFPDLSNKYHVMGVPRTVINETIFQEGAAPEMMMLDKLKEAVAVAA
ncbi:MAG: thioredoxin family protein [Ardenticatenaceae bacterium]|nr:thioredoxin family protein [Ardenticatenaceae bacterium]MCB8974266.1 thioredoxin family protein [Ardenticatenaceae bacterium]